jgi:hypothetical protein
MSNPIIILNKHHKPKESDRNFYVGRGSALGNPFPITESRNRDAVIKDFEDWLEDRIRSQNKHVLALLNTIAEAAMDGTNKPVGLICFCAPKRCHAEIIRKVINAAIQGKKK